MIKVGDKAWHVREGEVIIHKVGVLTYGCSNGFYSFVCPKEDVMEKEPEPLFKISDYAYHAEYGHVQIVNVTEVGYYFKRFEGGSTLVRCCPRSELKPAPTPTEMLNELSDEDAAEVAELAFGKTLVYADESYKGLSPERAAERAEDCDEAIKELLDDDEVDEITGAAIKKRRQELIDTLSDVAKALPPTYEEAAEQREREVAAFSRQSGIFKEISDERKAQDEKYGEQNRRASVDRMTVALGEEFGEFCQALLSSGNTGKSTDKPDPRHELIQVAALAVAMIEMGDARPGWAW